MDQVIPNLWIGSLTSALNKDRLEERNIKYVLSAMTGRLKVDPRFVRYQISINDTESTDILIHLPPAIAFIDAALRSGKGVLVHCQAGISRSASIVAAYLMYSKSLTLGEVLDLMIAARPIVCPNDSFLRQLELFHQVSCQITSKDKATGAYYLERTVAEVLNRGDSVLETDMFARYPGIPTDPASVTPGGPRKRIRCKMCRQELATRERMLDHSQLIPSTPISPSQRSSDVHSAIGETSTIAPHQVSRRIQVTDGGRAQSLTTQEIRPTAFPILEMSTIDKPSSVDGAPKSTKYISSLALHNYDRDGEGGAQDAENKPLRAAALSESVMSRYAPPSLHGPSAEVMNALNAKLAMTLVSRSTSGNNPNSRADSAEGVYPGGVKTSEESVVELFLMGAPEEAKKPSSLRSYSAQAGLITKNSSLSEVVASPLSSPTPQDPGNNTGAKSSNSILTSLKSTLPLTSSVPFSPGLLDKLDGINLGSRPSPPITQKSKCSGYFLEFMKWMEPVLESSQISGKIFCPNKECNAKLGNYDWTGIKCSCEKWVTPGFCIHRSKVDEISVTFQ